MSYVEPTVFCGIVRNAASTLPPTLASLKTLRERCRESYVIIVTNDNTDGTDAILRDWAHSHSDVDIICADGLAASIKNRVDRIATARNFYLSYLHKFDFLRRFQFQVTLDLDGPNTNIDSDAFAKHATNLDFAWAGLFANQRSIYYDIYALRHPEWCPRDCWNEVNDAIPKAVRRIPKIRGILRRRAIKKYVHDRQYHIPKTLPPLAVQSAFGGFAIYKASAIQNIWYGSRTKNGQLVCEHVTFNLQLAQTTGNLYIAPSLLNDAPSEHVSSTSGRTLPLELGRASR